GTADGHSCRRGRTVFRETSSPRNPGPDHERCGAIRDPRKYTTQTMNATMNVVFTGGGTAGHVSPMLAMADALQRRYDDTEVEPNIFNILMIGTAEGMEATLIPDAGYDFATVAKVPMPRKPSRDL